MVKLHVVGARNGRCNHGPQLLRICSTKDCELVFRVTHENYISDQRTITLKSNQVIQLEVLIKDRTVLSVHTDQSRPAIKFLVLNFPQNALRGLPQPALALG